MREAIGEPGSGPGGVPDRAGGERLPDDPARAPRSPSRSREEPAAPRAGAGMSGCAGGRGAPGGPAHHAQPRRRAHPAAKPARAQPGRGTDGHARRFEADHHDAVRRRDGRAGRAASCKKSSACGRRSSFPARDGVAREIALVKMRAPRRALRASCWTWCSSTTPRSSTSRPTGPHRRAHGLRGLRAVVPPGARALRGRRGGPERRGGASRPSARDPRPQQGATMSDRLVRVYYDADADPSRLDGPHVSRSSATAARATPTPSTSRRAGPR